MSDRSLRASTIAQQQKDSSPSEADNNSTRAPPAGKRAKIWNSNATTSTKAADDKSNNPKSSPPTKARGQARTNPSNSSDPSKPRLKITEEEGDIFTAPPGTLLIHACNCEGSWGAGIAAAFKTHYPAAFGVYNSHCDAHGHELIGHALLIPPQAGDTTKQKGKENEKQHFVGCLFTSRSKGKKKDAPDAILAASGTAMRELIKQVVEEFNADAKDGEMKVGEVRMCKINSGLFAVPWEKTKAAMEAIEVDEGSVMREVKVIDRPS